jgi:SulP family sulfate permease
VYEINGPFFFGAASAFSHTVEQVTTLPKVLVVRLRHVPTIDATGLHALRRLVARSRSHGTIVVLAELQPEPRLALARAGLLREVETAHDLEAALQVGERIATGEHPADARTH